MSLSELWAASGALAGLMLVFGGFIFFGFLLGL